MRQKTKNIRNQGSYDKKIDFLVQSLSHIPRWVRLVQKTRAKNSHAWAPLRVSHEPSRKTLIISKQLPVLCKVKIWENVSFTCSNTTGYSLCTAFPQLSANIELKNSTTSSDLLFSSGSAISPQLASCKTLHMTKAV
jgi:hypothetical protein